MNPRIALSVVFAWGAAAQFAVAEDPALSARERWHAALLTQFHELKQSSAPPLAAASASIYRQPESERVVDADVVVLPPFTVSAVREIPTLAREMRRDQAHQAARKLSWQFGGPYVQREVGPFLVGVYSTTRLPIGLRISW